MKKLNIPVIILLLIVLIICFYLTFQFLLLVIDLDTQRNIRHYKEQEVVWNALKIEKQDRINIANAYHCPVEDTGICYTIVKIADEYGVSGQVMINLAWCESRLSPVQGKIDLRDRGWFQINSFYHPHITDACAYDLVCASHFTAEKISQGRGWEWHCW